MGAGPGSSVFFVDSFEVSEGKVVQHDAAAFYRVGLPGDVAKHEGWGLSGEVAAACVEKIAADFLKCDPSFRMPA